MGKRSGRLSRSSRLLATMLVNLPAHQYAKYKHTLVRRRPFEITNTSQIAKVTDKSEKSFTPDEFIKRHQLHAKERKFLNVQGYVTRSNGN